jgi:hypothetical protein
LDPELARQQIIAALGQNPFNQWTALDDQGLELAQIEAALAETIYDQWTVLSPEPLAELRQRGDFSWTARGGRAPGQAGAVLKSTTRMI